MAAGQDFPYNDILHLSRPVSEKHMPMDRMNRAAQFAPFAALTGHNEAIAETGRITGQKKVITEDAKAALDEKYAIISEKLSVGVPSGELSITYFSPDARKDGGTYLTDVGQIKKIDTYEKKLIMTSGMRIDMEQISEIEFL